MTLKKTLILVMTGLIPLVISCSTARESQRMKTENIREKRQEEAREQYEKAKKHHMELQSKETRKRMKHSQKEAERMAEKRSGKKEFFLIQWFKNIF